MKFFASNFFLYNGRQERRGRLVVPLFVENLISPCSEQYKKALSTDRSGAFLFCV
ncbi:hypothetical protein SB48_HM08orf06330 [Heyndrickxia coagulans]|uniref:Uncharacterized protein n=1 Tax=Heyndrickxia coagulans TaxID=1398 RepID=A0AAN0WDL6_HEYCO|nr:hypothetical protein SB48_HM08orf06330 [Heyndrickxia coagulans]